MTPNQNKNANETHSKTKPKRPFHDDGHTPNNSIFQIENNKTMTKSKQQ